ncbi:unnamed protein product [Chrysodeixis includens]|uniref:TOG domain-containing protein n=1 Tax=Chrysodeixis includens TaxID=689277 RepID=A0A9P0FRV0_CHRIL|nr:unnamed protein product [Chrysodeixis includens]
MDDDIEDVVGEVKLSESQKSVAMSNGYSMDFTDSSSEKQNSSGKETYVLEWDSEDSESSVIQNNVSIVSIKDRPARPVLISRDAQCEVTRKMNKASSTGLGKCSFIAQETFTQTSKTIIELAESDGAVRKPVNSKSLETQTSFISITENKTVEYRIELSGETKHSRPNVVVSDSGDNHCQGITRSHIYPDSLENNSSKCLFSETENDKPDECISQNSSIDKMIRIINDESKENLLSEDQNEYENTSDFEQSPDTTEMEEDSLMEPKKTRNKSEKPAEEIPKAVDQEVAELYNKLYETTDFQMHFPCDNERRRFGQLTPLTEESVLKKESSHDVTPNNGANSKDDDVLFTNNAGIKVKLFPKSESNKESFKLPPIQGNAASTDTGNLNFLFTLNKSLKSGNLPSVLEDRREKSVDRWEMTSKDLASGESPLISCRSESERISHMNVLLPPIHAEGTISSKSEHQTKSELTSDPPGPISIKEKIKELKMSHRPRNYSHSKYSIGSRGSGCESRSNSPSTVAPEDKMADAAERGCELLCIELLKRLRSHSWFEIADALEDVPRVLEKFWGIIAEHRIADLIRQVTAHVESPRTQVARAACSTLAIILKNTNYTKKPDFYEAVTILLTKTGSFSRPVRRAANVALDDIVCGIDLSHSVTALCIHGATHKSALVRCAAARLLVVCCALGGGGRELLRARPPTAVNARKHALRSLAALLDDKSTDARKYAERLYSMLRPLSNFEAYYLTDVDVDVASRQMKKYDQLLLCGPPEAR